MKHRFISGAVSQHVSSYNVLQKCFTGNVVFWNQLQRSNASNKTSDHLATDIQSTHPSTQTTVRKDQWCMTKLYERLRGRLRLSGRFSACFAGISAKGWRKQLVCDIVKNVYLFSKHTEGYVINVITSALRTNTFFLLYKPIMTRFNSFQNRNKKLNS